MDASTELRGLLAAVVIQAADDYGNERYRQEAKAFFLSEGFAWLWETLTDGVAGMPHFMAARQQVLAGQAVVGRKAYHARYTS